MRLIRLHHWLLIVGGVCLVVLAGCGGGTPAGTALPAATPILGPAMVVFVTDN